MNAPAHLRCTFCSRLQEDVAVLLAGPRGYICEQCIECAEVVRMSQTSQRGPCSFCTDLKLVDRDGSRMGITDVFSVGAGALCAACICLSREVLDDKLPND